MANAEPLNTRLPVVKEDGSPTEFFIRWAQQFSAQTVGQDALDPLKDDILQNTQDIELLDMRIDGLTLQDLVDTDVEAPLDTQVLAYRAFDQKWYPRTVSGGGGGGGGTPTAPLSNGDIPLELVDDSEGQTISVSLDPGVETRMQAYMGVGGVAEQPPAARVPTGATAFYWDTDAGALRVWTGAGWGSL